MTVLDHRGNIVPGFKAYCVGRFSLYGTDPPPVVDEAGIVRAEDSLGRSGYINVRGEIQYPEVSLKYRSLYRLSEQVFGANGKGGFKVVNKENRDYFPALEMDHLGSATAWPVFGGQGFTPIPGLREARYKVKYTAVVQDELGERDRMAGPGPLQPGKIARALVAADVGRLRVP
jgi:hypothetical protein